MSWTGKGAVQEWSGRLAGTRSDVELADAVLPLLRIHWPEIEDPETAWSANAGVAVYERTATGTPIVAVICKAFDRPNLDQGHLRDALSAIETFSRSGSTVERLLFVHNQDGRAREFHSAVSERLRSLKCARGASLLNRQAFVTWSFDALLERLSEGIHRRSQELRSHFEGLFRFGNVRLAEVPIAQEVMEFKSYEPVHRYARARPGRANVPGLLQQSSGTEWTILTGIFGMGKTTAALDAATEAQQAMLVIPVASVPASTFGAGNLNSLLQFAAGHDDLLASFPEPDKEQLRRATGALLSYFLRLKPPRAVLVLDGLDEHHSLSTLEGLSQLANQLAEVTCPVVLTTRREHLDLALGDVKATFGRVAPKYGSVRRAAAIELLEWDLKDSGAFISAAIKTASENEVARLKELLDGIETGVASRLYGDLLRHPLFLQFIVESVIERGMKEMNRTALLGAWIRMKLRRDRIPDAPDASPRASPAGSQMDVEVFIEQIVRVMEDVAFEMTEKIGGQVRLLEAIDGSRVEALFESVFGQEPASLLAILLNSLLIGRCGHPGDSPLIGFSLRIVQEFMLANSLVRRRVSASSYPQTVRQLAEELLETSVSAPPVIVGPPDRAASAANGGSRFLLDDLTALIARREAVCFVGEEALALSVSSAQRDLATWTGLLKNGVQRCVDLRLTLPAGWRDRQLGAVESGDPDELLGVSEQVTAKLKGAAEGEFGRWLMESAGALRVGDPSIFNAIRDLGLTMVTTNYDGLLEEVTGLPAETWKDGALIERILRGDDQGIIHLHGYYRQPESIVLGIRSRENLRTNEHAQAVLRAIRTMKSLLFIGFGRELANPNFTSLLTWSRQVFSESHYRHFRLVLSQDVAEVQKQHPGSERIFVLEYGNAPSDLAPFLRSLAASPASRTESRSATHTRRLEHPLLFVPTLEWHSAPAALLRADHAIVPFHGREAELSALGSWVKDDSGSLVKLLAGPGGMGKTRFARELCLQMKRDGIPAGFLHPSHVAEYAASIESGPNQRALIVIDYAESEVDRITPLLRTVAARNLRSLRILLLARGAGSWWSQLKRKGDGVGALIVRDPEQLGPLALAVSDRLHSFDLAREAFSQKLAMNEPANVPDDLEAVHYERTLLLHMSALLAVQGRRAQGIDPILEAVLGREAEYWCRQLRSRQLPEYLDRGFERAMGVISGYGGVRDRREAIDVVSQIGFFKGQARAVIEGVVDTLHDCYPGERWIEPVQPDLLKEYLVFKATAEDPEDFDNIVLTR